MLPEEELFIRLRGAINELPEKYKEVISLNLEVEDKEIAFIWEYLLMLLSNRKKVERTVTEKLNHPVNFID
ncbi:MAG: hypothetical protein ACLTZT_11150 [Butyricimonas faecalis]